jgi:hypothetical protein
MLDTPRVLEITEIMGWVSMFGLCRNSNAQYGLGM